MQRRLFLLALGLGLLCASSASAIVITSSEAALLGHGGGPPQSLSLESNGWTPQRLSLSVTPLLALELDSPRRFGRRAFAWAGATHRATPDRLREIAARLFGYRLPNHLGLPMLDGPLYHPRRPARPIDAIPEPGTAMLFGAGLVGMGLWRRRRR